MNNKGFAISVILYSMVFLLISIFYMLLSIVKTRYNTSISLRDDLIEELNESHSLYDLIAKLGDESGITYVEKYDLTKGAPIDTPDGSGNKSVYYYTSNNSSNLAGQNGNVIFGDFCWQIVRTTATGGVKLIYNGPKTNDNKCPNDNSLRPASIGVTGATGNNYTSMSGNKLCGTSFSIVNVNGTNKFKLKNTNTYTWSESTYEDIIGKFICGTSSSPTGTSDTCDDLYYVGAYLDNYANTTKFTINSNTHYTQIGTSTFNSYSDAPSSAGYMFNKIYANNSKYFPITYSVTKFTSLGSTGYYFGDKAVWNTSTSMYDLKVDDGNGNYVTPTTTSTWANIRSNAKGKYICVNGTDRSCAIVRYIITNSTSARIEYVELSNNEDINTKGISFTYGTSYSESNGTYTLTGGGTQQVLLKDWPDVYNNGIYKNMYVCSDFTSTTCSEIYHFGDTNTSYIYYNKSSNNYIFGNSVTYSNGSYIIDTSTDSTKYLKMWDLYKDKNNIKNARYTCYKTNTNDCGNSVLYVNYADGNNIFSIELKNGETLNDAYNNMLNVDNSTSSTINRYNSSIKGIVDSWYESNLLNFTNYLDSDAVYCNNRKVKSYGSWPSNSNFNDYLTFDNYGLNSKTNASLSCPNVTDRFSKNNNIAKLKYPIGLISLPELRLMETNYAKNGQQYYVGTPYYLASHNLHLNYMSTSSVSTNSSSASRGVRPVITLKPGLEVTGKGTYNSPYIVDTSGAEVIVLKNIGITAKNQTIDLGSTISSATNQVDITGGLRAGDHLQSITLTQSTTAVTSNGTISPSHALIYDEDGNDVTNLYNIDYSNGTLVINNATVNGNSYTIEYYLGNGTSTNGVTKIGTSTCTFGSACTLKLFSSFNKAFPYSADDTVNSNRGWSFYGWATSVSSTTRTYVDGVSINPGTYTSTITLYALGQKNYRFSSGIKPKSYVTRSQIWNPRNTGDSYRTAISIPSATDLSSQSNGTWTFIGYIGGDNSANNNTVDFAANLAGTSYKPAIDTASTGSMRAKYQRTLTIKYLANTGSGTTTDSTLIQYYNSGIGSPDGTVNSGSKLGSYAMTLKNSSFTKSGYGFKNWAETSTTGQTYAAGAAYNKLGSTEKTTKLTVNMYAMWNRCCTGHRVGNTCYTNEVANTNHDDCDNAGYYYADNKCYRNRETLYC